MAQLKNTTIDDTGFLQLPAGTTAERPASPTTGMIRYNTSTGVTEWYDGSYSLWFPVGVMPIVATGGSISNITPGGFAFRIHSFTSSGTFTVTRAGTVEYLIVAGGGGGANGNPASDGNGGGGAGGLLTGSIFLTENAYTITVGTGGAGGAASAGQPGANGQNSSAFGFTAIGGGKGGNGAQAGAAGGSHHHQEGQQEGSKEGAAGGAGGAGGGSRNHQEGQQDEAAEAEGGAEAER
jgi:hypothetical protein